MDGLDYYAPHALVQLDRHVALAGPPAVDLAPIGHYLASLCGITFHELARLVEHDAGMSWAKLAKRARGKELERQVAKTLRRALADRPFGVIVVGHLPLPWRLRWRLRRKTRLLYIDRPLNMAIQSARKHRARTREQFPEFMPGGLLNAGRLRAAHEDRRRDYQRMATILEVGEAPTLRVAQQIKTLIEGG